LSAGQFSDTAGADFGDAVERGAQGQITDFFGLRVPILIGDKGLIK
jgi:hypothetical protein